MYWVVWASENLADCLTKGRLANAGRPTDPHDALEPRLVIPYPVRHDLESCLASVRVTFGGGITLVRV